MPSLKLKKSNKFRCSGLKNIFSKKIYYIEKLFAGKTTSQNIKFLQSTLKNSKIKVYYMLSQPKVQTNKKFLT